MTDLDEWIADLAQEAQPVTPAPQPARVALTWLGAALLYLALSLGLTGLRPDLAARLQEPWYLVEILLLVGILAAASMSAALLAYPDCYQRRRWAALPGYLVVLFVLAIGLSWRADFPAAPLPAHSYQCALSIALTALLPAAWLFHGMRRFAATHFRLAGVVVLLYAFAIGALWLRLHELNNSVIHVILWHYLPTLAAALLGMVLGRWLLRW